MDLHRTLSKTTLQYKLTATVVLCLLLCACKKEDLQVQSMYSTKYRVVCGFEVSSYPELQPAVGGFGIYATIRQSGTDVIISSEVGTQAYDMRTNKLMTDFQFGLGGLMVGCDFDGTLRCFDLGCPNCDQAQYRLTVKGDVARCSHCEIEYQLSNLGAIVNKGNGMHPEPRGLYQYHIAYNGMMIQMYN